MPTEPTLARARVLVGGVGYSNLRDFSAGPMAIARMPDLGEGVDVEDVSYSSIDLLFLLQRREPYAALILVTAASRGDSPGTVRVARWAPPHVDPESLQARIAETLTGVIDAENHLHVLEHFGALPEHVVVVEIEPSEQTWGDTLSPAVERGVAEAVGRVRALVAELVAA